jgi:L-alanine-DL-glutamate epimerase-like enolase superfamily enzyme
MKGQPLYKLWNTTWNGDIQTDYTIGIDSMDKMLDKIAAKPMPIYKIKVGMDDDIAILTTIRKTTDAVIRVDANSGWQIEQAIEKIKALRDLDIEFVEEPIERKNYTGMQQVFTNSVLPILADESCVEEKDMEDCATCFNGINIKLTKCGGLTPALSMIKKAKQLKLKVMVGCMNESTIGSAAMAHLSPQIDYIDMDGPLLLSEDLATGLEYNGANFSVSNEPGLGINITF